MVGRKSSSSRKTVYRRIFFVCCAVLFGITVGFLSSWTGGHEDVWGIVALGIGVFATLAWGKRFGFF